MRKNKNGLPEHKESRILQTKAEKIIFAVTIAMYAVIMISELKFTPHHNTISSSVAAFGVGAFLIARAVHIKKTRELIFAKDKFTWIHTFTSYLRFLPVSTIVHMSNYNE